MGHAGTLSAVGGLSADQKIARLKDAGVRIAKTPQQVVAEVLAAGGSI